MSSMQICMQANREAQDVRRSAQASTELFDPVALREQLRNGQGSNALERAGVERHVLGARRGRTDRGRWRLKTHALIAEREQRVVLAGGDLVDCKVGRH